MPTPGEVLRSKAYLVVRQNQTCDNLDVVALADRSGVGRAAMVRAHLDDYSGDQRPSVAEGVASQLVRRLAAPRPLINR